MSAVSAVVATEVVEVAHGRGKPRPRVFDWPQIAAVSPVLAATMRRYLDQVAVSLRPSSVTAANGILREFAGFLITEFPEINGLVDVDRHHVEAFKRHLGTRLSRNDTGRTLTPQRIRITEVLSAPPRNPLEGLRLELIDRLGFATCTVCSTLFERGDKKQWAREVVRNTGTGPHLKKAVEDGKGMVYWLDEQEARSGNSPDANYHRRYICPDCVMALFGHLTAGETYDS